MTHDEETDQRMKAVQREWKMKGYKELLIALLLACFMAGLVYVNYQADKAISLAAARDTRISNLEVALDAQRQQFEACKNIPAATPGCSTPVTPSSEVAGKQGVQGLQGIPGRQGLQGVQGIQGITGRDGKRGLRGFRGLLGATGPIGLTGKDGKNGNDGKDGTPGKDGENGKDGKDGSPGKDGADGSPGPACPADTFQSTVDVKTNDIPGDFTTIVTCVPLAPPAP